MLLRADEAQHLSTIYIGGGTPRVLTFNHLKQIFAQIESLWGGNWKEVTLECNPDDLTPSFIEQLTMLPVNRISMGIQTFDDKLLKFLTADIQVNRHYMLLNYCIKLSYTISVLI